MIVKTSTINRQNILTLELRKFTIFFIIVSPLYFIKCYNFFTYFIIISNYNPKYNVYKHFSLLLTPLIPYITSVKQKECYKKSTLSIAFFQILNIRICWIPVLSCWNPYCSRFPKWTRIRAIINRYFCIQWTSIINPL